MPYNKTKEEKKWKIWKTKEEKIMIEQGISKEVILKIREMDWDAFKAERRYLEHQVLSPFYIIEQPVEMIEPSVQSVEELLNTIDDEHT